MSSNLGWGGCSSGWSSPCCRSSASLIISSSGTRSLTISSIGGASRSGSSCCARISGECSSGCSSSCCRRLLAIGHVSVLASSSSTRLLTITSIGGASRTRSSWYTWTLSSAIISIGGTSASTSSSRLVIDCSRKAFSTNGSSLVKISSCCGNNWLSVIVCSRGTLDGGLSSIDGWLSIFGCHTGGSSWVKCCSSADDNSLCWSSCCGG